MNINEFTTPQLLNHANFWRRMIKETDDDPIFKAQAINHLKEFEDLIAQRQAIRSNSTDEY